MSALCIECVIDGHGLVACLPRRGEAERVAERGNSLYIELRRIDVLRIPSA